MIFSVTGKITSALVKPLVIEPQDAAAGRRHNAKVKIDQVGVICTVALCAADAVRIMTGIAGGPLIIDMGMMFLK